MGTCITGKTCDRLTGIYKKDIPICSRCKEIYKIDLARIVLKLNPIYLTEDERFKDGKTSKITDKVRDNIKVAYEKGKTMRELAKKHHLSLGTIHNIIHK